MLTTVVSQAHMLRRVRLFPSRRGERIMGMPASSKRRWTTSEVRALMDESRPWTLRARGKPTGQRDATRAWKQLGGYRREA
jgi:hypothetical protein